MLEKPFSPRKEVLPQAQQELWNSLMPSRDLGLVLYGGTAIALRLGHRISVDFDFFTEKPLNKDLIREVFSFVKNSEVIQDAQDTFSLLTAPSSSDDTGVKVSFFGNIGFGRVGLPELTQDGVMHVASLDDLMATKVKTILQRVNAKDYIDIAAMVEAGVSLAQGLAAAREMYGINFQPIESMKAMTYFKDLDRELSATTKEILTSAVAGIHTLPQVRLTDTKLGLSQSA